jgi:hypothetical protein
MLIEIADCKHNPQFSISFLIGWWIFERAMGFEPTTFSLARRRSTTELRPHFGYPSAESAESQNRTDDTAIFSRVLYQLSYLGGRYLRLLSVRDFTRTREVCQEAP